jgi:hypothetical protein
MAKAKGRNGAPAINHELPLPVSKDVSLRTVNEVLRGVEKGKFRAAAKTIWRRNMIVLGAVLKEISDEEIGEYLVIPRTDEKPELRRDDLMMRLLEQRAKHRHVDVYTFAELTRTLPDSCQKAFAANLVDRFASNRWPAGVRTLRRAKNQRCLFLLEEAAGAITTATATTVTPPNAANGEAFASAFNRAFERLRGERPFNMVELVALRTALSGYSREQFDRGLHALRKSGEFLLETFEGRHGSLSSEELAASIREDGRVFAFAARRDRG